MVYLSLDKEYVEKNKEKMNKEAIEEFGEECKNDLLYADDKLAEVEEIDDNLILTAECDTEIGYISVGVELKDDDVLKIIEILTRKFENYKEVLEKLNAVFKQLNKDTEKEVIG